MELRCHFGAPLTQTLKIELAVFTAEIKSLISAKEHVLGFGPQNGLATNRIDDFLRGVGSLNTLFDLRHVRKMCHEKMLLAVSLELQTSC